MPTVIRTVRMVPCETGLAEHIKAHEDHALRFRSC